MILDGQDVKEIMYRNIVISEDGNNVKVAWTPYVEGILEQPRYKPKRCLIDSVISNIQVALNIFKAPTKLHAKDIVAVINYQLSEEFMVNHAVRQFNNETFAL